MTNTQDIVWELARSFSLAHNLEPTHVIMPIGEYQKFARWVYQETGGHQLPLQWYGMKILSSHEVEEIKVGILI